MSSPARLFLEALSPEAYKPYGDVIMAAPRGETGAAANQGTAGRFDHLATLEDHRPGRARLNVSVFRCAPRPVGDFSVDLLEKHPASTQMFVPMNATRFLVVVALGGAHPDLGTLRAFLASGLQGITYRPGVWHHPLLALDKPTDFTCLVHEDGTKDDCVVVELPQAARRVVAIEPAAGSVVP